MEYELPLNYELNNATTTAIRIKNTRGASPTEVRQTELIIRLNALVEILLMVQRSEVVLPPIPQNIHDQLWLSERDYFLLSPTDLERVRHFRDKKR